MNLQLNSKWINRAIPTLIGLEIILISIIISVFIISLYPYEPIRIDKVILSSNIVSHGDKLCFAFEGEKFYDVSANVDVEMVNGEAFHIMSYSSNTPVGSHFKYRCFMVPPTAPPAKYQIRWTGIFHMNLLNNQKRVILSDFFEVTK